MNKHCFRLIFSKSLGILIPVAETTRSQRKPGQVSGASPSSAAPLFSLKHLAASLLLAGLPSWAFAELIVDPSAGETNVIAAPNGVPVIEIANPNGSGLSHNRFSEFDVHNPGLIFNNSQTNGVSQLGGALLHNPNLQRQATAILSEVTGNKPSSISGTLEVFGGRADILIAKAKISHGEMSVSIPYKEKKVDGGAVGEKTPVYEKDKYGARVVINAAGEDGRAEIARIKAKYPSSTLIFDHQGSGFEYSSGGPYVGALSKKVYVLQKQGSTDTSAQSLMDIVRKKFAPEKDQWTLKQISLPSSTGQEAKKD